MHGHRAMRGFACRLGEPLARALLPAMAGLAGCSAPISGSGGTAGAARPAPAIGVREERVLVGSYPTVEAIAVSRRYAFVAAQGGVLVYDRVREQWLPPLGVADGLGGLPIRAVAADPVDDALWIGLPGQLRIYRPASDQWVQLPLTGTPDLIAFERPGMPGAAGAMGFGDAWVRAGGWTRVSRAGVAVPADRPPSLSMLLLPPSPAQLAAQFPVLRTLAGGIPLPRVGNRPPRTAPMTTAALAPDRAAELWVGTAGGGLWQVDGFSGIATPRPFGLLSPGAGAMAPALGGVWVAGIGAPAARAGLTFVADNFQQWRWIDGTLAVPLEGVRVTALAVRGSVAWLGTDRGVVRVVLDGEASMARWSVLDGLPDDRVLAVAPRPEGSWVGTVRGVAFVSDTGRVPDRRVRGVPAPLLAGRPASALLVAGDTLWVGTEDGLVTIAPASPAAEGGGWVGPAGGDAPRRPIRALGASDSVLVVATDEQLLVRPVAGGAGWQAAPVDVRAVGRVLRMAADERSVYVGGTDGLVQWQRRTGGVRRLTVPGDLPGPVLDLLAAGPWLWVGTPAGLVRLRRSDDGGLWP